MIGLDVYRVLEEIAATTSRNDKEAILDKCAGDPLMRKVLKYAYDPFMVFGIGKLPARPTDGPGNKCLSNDYLWMILDGFANKSLTGNDAIQAVTFVLGQLDEESASVFGRILLKDLRAGIEKSTINRVIPRLIPVFACMLAKPFEAKRVKTWPQYADLKEDGVRVLAFVQLKTKDQDARVAFTSRSGKPLTTFDHLHQPLIAAMTTLMDDWRGIGDKLLPSIAGIDATLENASIVLDAEVVSGSFNNTVSEVRRKSEQAPDAILKIFDILPMSLFEDVAETDDGLGGYKERRQLAKAFVERCPEGSNVELMTSYMVNSEAEIHKLFEAVRARGKEGLIIKDPNGKYRRKRDYAWMKIKAEQSVDIRVTSAFEGSGKYEGQLGGLIADFKGVHVRVGGGFSDAQRVEIWEAFKRDEAKLSGSAVDLEVIGRLIEVEYHEVTPDGSLRHPRFVRWRDDKDGEEVLGEKEAA